MVRGVVSAATIVTRLTIMTRLAPIHFRRAQHDTIRRDTAVAIGESGGISAYRLATTRMLTHHIRPIVPNHSPAHLAGNLMAHARANRSRSSKPATSRRSSMRRPSSSRSGTTARRRPRPRSLMRTSISSRSVVHIVISPLLGVFLSSIPCLRHRSLSPRGCEPRARRRRSAT